MLYDELWVLDMSAKSSTFKFGEYSFTSVSQMYDTQGSLILSGDVRMNGWLRFKGNVTIEGAQNSNTDRLRIIEEKGVYVLFKQGSKGLAGFLGNRGQGVPFGKLDEFYIYSDKFDSDDYEEFPYTLVGLDNIDLDTLLFSELKYKIYPEFLEIETFNLGFNLPYQDQLFKHMPSKIPAEQISSERNVLISDGFVALIGDFSLSTYKENGFMNIGKLPANLEELTIGIDTLKNDYSLGLGIGIKALPIEGGLLFKVGVKGGAFDLFSVVVDGSELPIAKAPIPVTIKNFGYEIAGLSEVQGDWFTESEHSILFKVDVADLLDYVPKVEKFFDKDESLSVATLDDAKLTFRLSEFNIDFTADVVLFTILNVGEVQIQVGQFSYTNALIGYDNVNEYGLRGYKKTGIIIDTKNLDMNMNTSNELVLGYPYTGIMASGNMDYDVSWSVLKKDFDVNGDVMAGVYKNSSDNLQFSIIVKGINSKGKTSGFHLYFTGNRGLKYKKY